MSLNSKRSCLKLKIICYQLYYLNSCHYNKSTMMKKKSQAQVIFKDIKGENQPTVVESMCTSCEKNGTTTILFTKIPFFRELIITSFYCQHCGNRNNQVQFGGTLPDFGVSILFRALEKADFNRQLIKSEYSVIHFDEIDLQIPANGKAEINTIEGYLLRTYEQLKFHQNIRKIYQPQNYEKLQIFLQKTKEYIDGGKFPLTVRIRDPSGNSAIKNPFAPKVDKNMEISHFERSMEEMIQMGYSPQNAKAEKQAIDTKKICTKINFTKPFEQNNFMNQEPAIFAVPCHACKMMGQQRMCRTSVPYFPDLIIMSFKCDYCGAHSTETKNSGEVTPNACVLTLNVEGDDDLKRDLFKSQTCSVSLPQIELELGFGTLGGVFTTVEGLIQKIYDHFQESNPFVDSDKQFSSRIAVLLEDLSAMREGKRKFTMILIDPLSHSFFSNPYHPNPDPRLKIQFRPRTFDENEELGLNDIKVENYQQESHPEVVKQQQLGLNNINIQNKQEEKNLQTVKKQQ